MRRFTVAKLLICLTLEIYLASKIVSDLNNSEYKAICKNYKLSRTFVFKHTEKRRRIGDKILHINCKNVLWWRYIVAWPC